MEIVNHKTWGVGVVIRRENYGESGFYEVADGGKYIVVRFADGVEKRFGIPSSFITGTLTADGVLGEQVAVAIEERERLREEEEAKNVPHIAPENNNHESRTPKTSVKITLTGDLKADFATYLTDAGYQPTVVSAYNREVGDIAEEEGLTRKGLLRVIETIIPIYSEGGKKAKRGAYQNSTTINALKRYSEFGKTNPDARK